MFHFKNKTARLLITIWIVIFVIGISGLFFLPSFQRNCYGFICDYIPDPDNPQDDCYFIFINNTNTTCNICFYSLFRPSNGTTCYNSHGNSHLLPNDSKSCPVSTTCSNGTRRSFYFYYILAFLLAMLVLTPLLCIADKRDDYWLEENQTENLPYYSRPDIVITTSL